MRAGGVLMHITSLASPYGVGTLGKEAYEFVDFLEAAKQTYWQVLPIGPTGYGDSPYSSYSTYAGNPYLIDFDMLKEDGFLKTPMPTVRRFLPFSAGPLAMCRVLPG